MTMAMIHFRCWYCGRNFAVAKARAGERLTCGSCQSRLRVPRASGGNSRSRSLVDFLVEAVVYGGGGALRRLPAGGRVVSSHHVPGDLLPVNEGSAEREPRLFARNERFLGVMEGEVGTFVVIMVAAVGVGHITASFDPEVATHLNGLFTGAVRSKLYPRPPVLSRGDEFGIFHLGSTAIILFERGRVVFEPVFLGSHVRMGTRIGHLRPRP